VFAVETTNRAKLAQEFTSSHGITFPIVLDDQKLSAKLYEVKYTPTTCMIDRKGQVIFRSIGYSPGHEKALAAQIEYLLKSS
jgi:hypothetical protein